MQILRLSTLVLILAKVAVMLSILHETGAAQGDFGTDPRAEPEAYLAASGLKKVPGGGVWVLPQEQGLRDLLRTVPRLQRNIVALQTGLDERIQRNRLVWETNQVRIHQLQKLKATLEPEEIKQRKIDEQIASLREQAVPPDRLNREADVRRELMELVNQRHRLALALLDISRTREVLDRRYPALARDERVSAALRELGASHRLGPLGDSYQDEIRRAQAFRTYTFTNWVPLYIQSGRARVGAILNEQTPAVFTWTGSHDPTTLLASMAESAGITVPAGVPTVQLPIRENRTVPARRVQIPSIRLGSFVFRDVEVHILSAEDEDLGAQLGLDTLIGCTAREEPERLRLLISRDR